MWLIVLSNQLPIFGLVGRYPTNYLMGRELIQECEVPKDPPLFPRHRSGVGLSGISTPFEMLSQAPGQITHVLLTRAPLYSPTEVEFRARLACVRPAASVRSEPGSNSPVQTR